MPGSSYHIANSIAGQWYFVKRNFVTEKDWSPGYFTYRILRPFLKLYNRLLNIRYGKNKPWLSAASIRILEGILNSDMEGLEYGSGRSTLFFARKVKHLTCIEHHEQWFDLVSKELHRNGVDNVDYIKIPVSITESKKEIEQRYKSVYDNELDIYLDYFAKAKDFPDSFFDFVIIDGRARVECSKRTIPKLKSGGIFILDNSERKRYEPIHSMFSDWEKVNTTTGLTDTTFWFKP